MKKIKINFNIFIFNSVYNECLENVRKNINVDVIVDDGKKLLIVIWKFF